MRGKSFIPSLRMTADLEKDSKMLSLNRDSHPVIRAGGGHSFRATIDFGAILSTSNDMSLTSGSLLET